MTPAAAAAAAAIAIAIAIAVRPLTALRAIRIALPLADPLLVGMRIIIAPLQEL
jgi:hypothetical protein